MAEDPYIKAGARPIGGGEIRGAGYETAQSKDLADLQAKRLDIEQKLLANKRRRATPEEVEAQGLDPNISYQIDGFGRFHLNPGQPPAKRPVVDQDRAQKLKSVLGEIEKSEKMAREGFLTVGRPAEIITNLPFVGGLLNQPRVDFEATNESIKARLMQDAMASLAEANQGGVSKLGDTPLEAQRMAASIANLDPSQSRERFLEQLQRARQYTESGLAKLGAKYPDGDRSVASPQKVRVPLPDGRVASFPDQESANAFKRKAGIR